MSDTNNGRVFTRDPWIGLNSIDEMKYMHGGSTAKRSKLECMDSIFTENHFLGLSDRDVNDKMNYFPLESTDMYGEGFVRTCHDNNLTDAQIVPVQEYENKQPGCYSTYLPGIARCSFPQYQSVPVGGFHSSIPHEQVSVADETNKKVNFSLFLRAQTFMKANNQSNERTISSNCPKLSQPDEPKSNGNGFAQANTRNLIESTSIEPTYGYKSITGLENQPNSIEKVELKLPYPNHTDGSFARSSEPRVISSSACSHKASNNLGYTLKRRYEEDSYESTTHISESFDEESESEMDVKPGWGSKRAGRNRRIKDRNLLERKRRRKLHKKMRALQELIPDCHKVDRVSMLDDAIEYLKTLQLQIQMMSMGQFCMPTRMMLPLGMQQTYAQHFPHPSLMSFGCGPAPFLASPISGPTFLPGFSGQAVPMSNSSSPFLPFLGGSSAQSMMVPGFSRADNLVQLPTSATCQVQRVPIWFNDEMNNMNSQ